MIQLLINVLAVCGLCAWVSAFTPATSSNKYVQYLLNAINFAAGNVIRAKRK